MFNIDENTTVKEIQDFFSNGWMYKIKIRKLEKQLKKTNELLRRVYNVVERHHLNDWNYDDEWYNRRGLDFRVSLGKDIFNWLQSHDNEFKKIVIKRQKRWRERQKRKLRNCSNCRFSPSDDKCPKSQLDK